MALAVLGWIGDTAVTEPRIEELHATSDDFVFAPSRQGHGADAVLASKLCNFAKNVISGH